MRLRFPIAPSSDERDEREELLLRIDRWWRAFSEKTGRLDALFHVRAEWDLPKFMEEHLQAVHPYLMWEFGPGRRGGHRLVITPEFRHRLRPLVDVVLQRAPRIDGWELYPYRLPEPLELALATVDARTETDVRGVTFLATVGPSHLVDLCFYAEDEEIGPGEVVILAETLLGEETLDRWVGVVDVQRTVPPEAEPLEHLRERVEERVDLVLRTLPGRRIFETADGADWTLLELSPEEEDDYAGQDDLLVAKTRYLEMWKTAHMGRRFSSSRFSRHGEVFAYVKIDGTDGLTGSQFEDKSAIEDAIDDALVPLGLGCHVGGGTGRVYSYVDVALADVDRGVETLRDVLRAGGLPKRSWIQFFDDEWGDEWIGIHDDSPPPPMPDREE